MHANPNTLLNPEEKPTNIYNHSFLFNCIVVSEYTLSQEKASSGHESQEFIGIIEGTPYSLAMDSLSSGLLNIRSREKAPNQCLEGRKHPEKERDTLCAMVSQIFKLPHKKHRHHPHVVGKSEGCVANCVTLITMKKNKDGRLCGRHSSSRAQLSPLVVTQRGWIHRNEITTMWRQKAFCTTSCRKADSEFSVVYSVKLSLCVCSDTHTYRHTYGIPRFCMFASLMGEIKTDKVQ